MQLKNFEKHFDYIARYEDAHRVFDDFLTMCICCFSINPLTGKSEYEDEYLKVVGRYDKSLVREHFPKLMSELIIQMEQFHDDPNGNDLLGEFYQRRLSKGQNGQYFTPEAVTNLMAQILGIREETRKQLNILDPACGSGRMLTSAAKKKGKNHNFYGIDTSPYCVKMSAINLFLNGLNGEVMCANALDLKDFKFSYRIRMFPLGIRKILEKQHSQLWHMQQLSKNTPKSDPNGQLSIF